MRANEIAILVNTTFSLVELLVRLKQQSPKEFENQEEKIKELKLKVNVLGDKPADYLENWKPE